MKDNFDLRKFLIENKTFENLNPFFTDKTLLKEGDEKLASVRKKIRELVIAELGGGEDYELEDRKTQYGINPEIEDDIDLDEAKKKKGDDEETVDDVEVEDTEEFSPEPEPEPTPDLDGGEKEIMDSLENALEFAKQKGDEKLVDQIGNTITFFTRQYIVK